MSVCVCRAPYLRRWLLTALLFLAAVVPTSGACPSSCACHAPTEVHCTFRYLTAIPDHIQTAAERINLGYNSITVLKEYDLSGLENLELLLLHSNTIHTIEDRAFQDLKSLQVLKMSYNKVKEINKETFKGLESLMRLHMDNNHIEFISPEAFYGLTSLQLVHLEGNYLQQLHPDTFVTLRHSQVFKLSSLRNIHLSDNLLTTLPADIFSGCSQLENVFLHGNPWTCDCRMQWFPAWGQRNPGVLKCKRDRGHSMGQLCPMCENPTSYYNRPVRLLSSDAFTCTKPWIKPHLKQNNISLDEGDFTPVSPKDFIAPLGSIQMNLTDQFHSGASLSCTVQRPTAFENLTQTLEEEEGNNITMFTASITTYLVCNTDYEHIQQLWQILATYSNSPMRLERGPMLARSPEMVYSYSQIKKDGEEEIHTNIEAEIKASPAWLMQGEISFQLDRTTTTYSTLHIKYQSVVNLRVENTSPRRGQYSWTMIKRDNQTKTEHTVLTGGVAQLSCQIQGEPKPLLEWILPDGSKVRAPYSSDDRRIIITADGKLTVRSADASDTGLYWCIATNYLDADILVFRVTVLSPDVEDAEVNGVRLSRPLGENLVLDCSASGTPEASVQWILPDHSVLDKSHESRMVYDNGTLLIKGLTARDRGFYRCLVANHLGVDLLVSQLTVTGERPDTLTFLDSEGSGMKMDVKVNPSLTEKRVTLSEVPSSSPSDITSQESRTITSDRPYPRLRPHGRGSSRRRPEQRRRGPFSNRRSRIFDKSSRKVDPQKFAELMKKAQGGSNVDSDTEKNQVNYEDSQISVSGDGDIGSGEVHNEDFLIVVPRIVKPTADSPQKNRIFGEDKHSETITTKLNENHLLTATGADQTFGIETTVSNHINLNKITENTSKPAIKLNIQSDSTPIRSTYAHNPGFVETTELYAPQRTRQPPNMHPVTLQLTVTDTLQETQLQFSGEQYAEPKTSTGAALPFTTVPNITPVRDEPDPMELVIHTDPESQTTFTAVTTTERQQDEITFHTTQTIKSPRLPGGSTIISRQQIHIIPHIKGRGGRRRNFQGRRRIIKPNRITDIQSFINKLKQSSVKMEGNTSVPYRIELNTDCNCNEDTKKTATTNVQVVTPTASSSMSLHKTERPASTQKIATSSTNDMISTALFTHTEPKPEVSSGYMISAERSEFESSASITTTTTASKIIHGRITWDRLFGGRIREKLLGRVRRPFIFPKTSTTTETTTLTTTPATMPPTTVSSLIEPVTLVPSRHTDIKESSLDDDYGDSASADFELTTLGLSFHDRTTTSSPYYSRSSTTAETPPELQTLSPPPIISPLSTETPDEALSSGSGRVAEGFVIRKRPGKTRGRQGRRRRPFRGRRPYKTPGIPKLHPATTIEATTTEAATVENTVQTTALPQGTVSLYKPLYASPGKEDRTTVAVTSEEETDVYNEADSLPAYSRTMTPLNSSPAYNPTTLTPTTTKWSYTTVRSRFHSSIRPPPTRTPPTRRIRPTLQSSAATGKTDKDHPVTILTAEQGHTNTPVPENNIGKHSAISGVYNHVTNNEPTRTNTAGFETTTQILTNKPKIVGGNAASFTVLSNSDAFLPCEAVGNPQPYITWKRFSSNTGSPDTITGKIGKFELLSNGTLFIENANINDRGQYICLAENDHGSDKLFVTLSVVAYPSRILEPKMRDIKSHAGNTVEMKCKAEGRPTPMISWILANRTQVKGQITAKGRVSVSDEGTLVIEHVSVYDRGHYKCIASNPAGADTATVRLQVVAAPPGIIEEKRQHLKASVSQTLWLPCTGQGSPQPTIHWVLDDGSVVESNKPATDPRILVYKNGTFHIKDVTQADSGKYECIATSSTGSERRVVTLTVERQESAPKIMKTSQHMTELSFGDQLRLNCLATGDPKPRMIWRLPSKAVVDYWHRMGNRIHVLDNGTLIVNTVSDKDAGDYLCVARNKIGDDLQLMRVLVSMKPAKIESKLYGKKQVPYGNDLKVDCKASGAPKPEISWGLPDGTVVNSALQSDASSGRVRARRYTLFDNGTLYLNQVGMSEEGDYTCYAENQVGKDEMHVHITVVTAAPRIHSPSQTYGRMKTGGNIRFDCEATGEPKPKILWLLPTNDVIAASNERYLMHVNGSLDIRDVTFMDAGQYVCMARNPAGENRKVYKLDVEGNPPVINGYRQNRTVIKDVAAKYSRKLIDCKVEGDPTPSITWIMPDNIFLKAPYFGSRITVHHNGTLEIRNVRPTDTAEFICLARNDGGEAVMVVQLEVTSMLQRPIFKNPFNERIVSRIGKTTVLNCSADGYPIPEIIWTLPNGTRFNGGPDHGSHLHIGNDGTLVIYSPRKEDTGKYRCGAKNVMGYIEKLIILDVGQKPYILTRPRGIIRSLSGEPLFLHCLSDGNPTPRVYWTIPGGHTLTRPQILGRYQLLENGTLVVQDTNLHDRGNYVCRARNDAGEAVLTVPVIIVGYPPQITKRPPPTVTAVTGTPIQLNCAATGIPRPEITWELPGGSILSTAEQGRPMGTELLHPQGTLIIQRPTVSDSGTYKCLAKNHLGTHSKVTYVRVL
ncbi:immunoglobulin superfamily member 10 [Mastacembelus armatus]|uniref:Immunoglobulin superfamily, member 10 n=1 Tax=Mastacembelus armatus TaxID=205130 RepID=A0A3Q3LXA7_9TELE|nr:immunoglobulin superfamily member 10 [Mastacembelus armatus]XP_026155037.1 immunoglobulin superfamily member 10 [Mastacembelus armatus]XP_026155038.1 immunoglobulin superfamily member 10 [Mastacembelus armatus]